MTSKGIQLTQLHTLQIQLNYDLAELLN